MINGATYKLTRYGEDIFLDPTITTTTTITTPTPTLKPVQIDRTVYSIPPHHMIIPGQCGVQGSNKLKSKISKYSVQGFCWNCKQSVRRQKRIYYADDKATSFDFPWFVRVGTEYSLSAIIKICFIYKQY